MPLLQVPEFRERMALSGEKQLYIDPLLDEAQVGEVSIDLRVGPDFLVSLLTRKPSIEIAPGERRAIGAYFRMSRRDLGEKFILYPSQVVLACSMEYVALPPDLYADIITRSSYSRLGVHLNTMIQPGFRGCIPFELVNHGNNPIEIIVGSRLVQMRLFTLEQNSSYQTPALDRKYMGNVRPIASRAQEDKELSTLAQVVQLRG